MAQIYETIEVKFEKPEVSILMEDGSERLATFHKWTECEHGKDFALIENTEGIMEHVPFDCIRFLHADNEIYMKELEQQYKENGLLRKEGNDSW